MDANSDNKLELLRAVLTQAYGWELAGAQDSIDLVLPEGLPVSVSLSSDGAQWVFYSVLQTMVSASDVVLLAAALSLNLHQEATRGGAIGLDADAAALVYSLRLPLETDISQLLGALDEFCGVALELSDRLQAQLDEMPESERQRLQRAAAGLSELADLMGDELVGIDDVRISSMIKA